MTGIRYNVGALAALAALGLLAACSGGGDGAGGDGGTGTISLAIMDAPVYDATNIFVTFTGVSLKPQGGPAIDVVFPEAVQLDLLALNVDNAESLLAGHPVPAGRYSWLELHVSAEHDGQMDSYAVLQNGGVEEIEVEVPSGSIRLVSGLTITANQEASFLIDWNLHKGLNDPVGHTGLFLRPALRIIDMTQFGTLNGTVATPLVTAAGCANDLNLDLGNSVYIYAGTGVTPDDFDAADPEPVATTAVTQNRTGDYVYETLLSPGAYTVTFTCQAMNDLPDTNESIAFVQPQPGTIVDGQTTTINFVAPGAAVDASPDTAAQPSFKKYSSRGCKSRLSSVSGVAARGSPLRTCVSSRVLEEPLERRSLLGDSAPCGRARKRASASARSAGSGSLLATRNVAGPGPTVVATCGKTSATLASTRCVGTHCANSPPRAKRDSDELVELDRVDVAAVAALRAQRVDGDDVVRLLARAVACGRRRRANRAADRSSSRRLSCAPRSPSPASSSPRPAQISTVSTLRHARVEQHPVRRRADAETYGERTFRLRMQQRREEADQHVEVVVRIAVLRRRVQVQHLHFAVIARAR